jgi:hypothetical protein
LISSLTIAVAILLVLFFTSVESIYLISSFNLVLSSFAK